MAGGRPERKAVEGQCVVSFGKFCSLASSVHCEEEKKAIKGLSTMIVLICVYREQHGPRISSADEYILRPGMAWL